MVSARDIVCVGDMFDFWLRLHPKAVKEVVLVNLMVIASTLPLVLFATTAIGITYVEFHLAYQLYTFGLMLKTCFNYN